MSVTIATATHAPITAENVADATAVAVDSLRRMGEHAEMRGINTTLNKITAFCVAAFFTGLVGGMWAYQNTFIDPDVVFFESRTVELVMMSMLGGMGTVAGPVVGAATIYWMRDVVWANFADYHLMVEGFLMIMIVLYMPEGIMGRLGNRSATSIQRIWRRTSRGDEATEEVPAAEEVEQ